MSHLQPILPPKVQERLLRHDNLGEVLARLLQIGIVVVFGALYVSAPRTDAGTPFQLVPYILAAYLAFTAFGLVWALRARLPDSAVYLTIIIDVALLMALIWSFHLQYGQPAAFYLKAPTFLYLFILIAIRALRFEPRFVLVAGLCGVVGWSVLVGYVLVEDGSEAITRDYTLYLTASRLLIGAEVDKLVSIGIVTLVLWLALRRARTLLLQATTDAAAVENLSRFFDEPVAERIAAASEMLAAEGELRDAVILVTDLRDFSEHSALLAPRETLALLSAYQREVVTIVRRHGGSIDKFLGDGVLISFGAVRSHGSPAASALSALDDLLDAAGTWPDREGPLGRLALRSLGAAAASGPVIFGTVGDPRHLEYTVIGAPVNLAAKLEALNKAHGTQALATGQLLASAIAEGYRPRVPLERFSDVVPGFGMTDIVAHRR